jgi:xanthine dehydrogenase accessory factor
MEGTDLFLFVEPLRPAEVLLLFGGGHISTCLVPLAKGVGFRVTVVDDREEFSSPQRFPDADQTLALPFEEAFERLSVTPDTYIAIITRGHIYDLEVLRWALSQRPAYIGMIGSRRKRDMVFAKLREEGASEERLREVHAPIGLAIGAETPEEIAVSIVAELIQERASRRRTEDARSMGGPG